MVMFPWELIDTGRGAAGDPTGDVMPSALGFTAAISAISSAGCTLEELVNELLW